MTQPIRDIFSIDQYYHIQLPLIPQTPALLDDALQNTQKMHSYFDELLEVLSTSMTPSQVHSWLLCIDDTELCMIDVFWKHASNTNETTMYFINYFFKPLLQKTLKQELSSFFQNICSHKHIDTLINTCSYIDPQVLQPAIQQLEAQEVFFIMQYVPFVITEELADYIRPSHIQHFLALLGVEKILPLLEGSDQHSAWFTAIAKNANINFIEELIAIHTQQKQEKSHLLKVISKKTLLKTLYSLKTKSQLLDVLKNNCNQKTLQIIAAALDDTILIDLLLHIQQPIILSCLVSSVHIEILHKAMQHIHSSLDIEQNFCFDMLNTLPSSSQKKIFSCMQESFLIKSIEKKLYVSEIIHGISPQCLLSITRQLQEQELLLPIYTMLTVEDKKFFLSHMSDTFLCYFLSCDPSIQHYSLIIQSATTSSLSSAFKDPNLQCDIIQYIPYLECPVIQTLSKCEIPYTTCKQLTNRIIDDEARSHAFFASFGEGIREFIQNIFPYDPVFLKLLVHLKEKTLKNVFLLLDEQQIAQFLENYSEEQVQIACYIEKHAPNLILGIILDILHERKSLTGTLEKVPLSLKNRLLWNIDVGSLRDVVQMHPEPITLLKHVDPRTLTTFFQHLDMQQKILENITESTLLEHKQFIAFFNNEKLIQLITANIEKNPTTLSLLIKKTYNSTLTEIIPTIMEQGLLQQLIEKLKPSMQDKLITRINRKTELYKLIAPSLSQALQKEIATCEHITVRPLNKNELPSIRKTLGKWKTECSLMHFPKLMLEKKHDSIYIADCITTMLKKIESGNNVFDYKQVYIAQIHNTLQGVAICNIHKMTKETEIQYLASNPLNIHPEFRLHSGVGTTLIAHIVSQALNENCVRTSLFSKTEALPFYKKLGFVSEEYDHEHVYLDKEAMQNFVKTHIL